MQEGDLHPDVGSNYEPHLAVWEGGHHLQVKEGGPHLQMMMGGPVLQVREGGPPLQVRVGGHHCAKNPEIHHHKQVKAAPSRSYPLHLQVGSTRASRTAASIL